MQCTCAILSSVSCPALKHFSTLCHKGHDFRKKNIYIYIYIAHETCVSSFSTHLSSWFYSSLPSFLTGVFLLQPVMFNHLCTILVDPLCHPMHLIMSRILSSSQSMQNTLSLRSARFRVLPLRTNTLKFFECGKDSQILTFWCRNYFFKF